MNSRVMFKAGTKRQHDCDLGRQINWTIKSMTGVLDIEYEMDAHRLVIRVEYDSDNLTTSDGKTLPERIIAGLEKYDLYLSEDEFEDCGAYYLITHIW